MEKINFENNKEPALNATNLNKLQQNVEEEINRLNADKLDKSLVYNEKNISPEGTYSCKYINDNCIIYYKYSEIIPTNEFLNDKRIYIKKFSTNETMNSNNNFLIKIPHGITNYDDLWIDVSNSHMYANKNDYERYMSIPIVSTAYLNNSTDEISATINAKNILIISNGSWNNAWIKDVTVKFTYAN